MFYKTEYIERESRFVFNFNIQVEVTGWRCLQCRQALNCKKYVWMVDVREAANFFVSGILDENLDLASDDRSERSTINSLSNFSTVNSGEIEAVRYTHKFERCPECEEGLCHLDFFKGLKDSFRELNPNPALRIALECDKNYLWDGKERRKSHFGEEMLSSKVRNKLLFSCKKDHKGCLICKKNGTVHVEKECSNEWTSNYSLIHLYFTLNFNK